MKLIFFRHGLAEERKSHHSMDEDFKRVLVKDGILETKKMVKAFQETFKSVDVIYTSTRLRAIQTAQLVSKNYPKTSFEFLASLDRMMGCETLFQEINFLKSNKNYLFAGHEPQLTEVISKLLNHPHNHLKLKKSGLAILEGNNSSDLTLTLLTYPKITMN